ncbi:hypothetical protein GCM10027299_18320 [Larkinella ripae]
MNIYNVSFDLFMERVDPSKKYDAFFDELKKTDTFRFWTSNWAVATNETEAELRDRLVQHLHKNDQIIVIPLDEWAAFARTMGLQWIKNHRDVVKTISEE